MAKWELFLSEADYVNILNGRQIVDTRVPDPSKLEKDYTKIAPYDILIYYLVKDGIVQQKSKIEFVAADVKKYKTVEDMLEAEGVENVCPKMNMEMAKEFYQSLPGHVERVKQNGIVAVLLGERL